MNEDAVPEPQALWSEAREHFEHADFGGDLRETGHSGGH